MNLRYLNLHTKLGMKTKLLSFAIACCLSISHAVIADDAADINRDESAEAAARYIGGTAVLYINTDGTWSVGKVGQKVSEYVPVKVGDTGGLNDDTFEFTALSVEANADDSYTLYLGSNNDPNQIIEVALDAQGNAILTSVKLLSQEEWFAAEVKWGVDLNENGGFGDQMVLVDAGQVDLYIDGLGNYKIQQADKSFKPLTLGGQPVTLALLWDNGLEIDLLVAKDDGGYEIYLSDIDDNVIQIDSDASGEAQAPTLKAIDPTALPAVEAKTGEDLNGKGDTPAPTGWTSTLKTAAVRSEVEAQTANGGKITHAGLVKIVNAAIQSTGGNAVGVDLFNDLKAIASRSKELFTAKDLAGNETDYLAYVFDKLVNGSKGNNFYTGGAKQKQSLGNLSQDSTTDVLQKLENKWLLGLDMPNPTTQGDTANPNASATSGSYKAFSNELIVGGIEAFDVTQGAAGTCYLLASIASLAQVNSGIFNSTFVSNGNDAGGTPTWGVRFFDAKGKTHWVTVNNQLVVSNPDDTNPAYAQNVGVDAQGSSTQEIWVPLLEKAYAQANELDIFARKAENAMFAIEGGLAEPLVNVGGGKVTQFTDSVYAVNDNPILTTSLLPEGSTALLEYTKALNSGKPLWLGSDAKTQDNGVNLFVSGHAYMVYDADLNSTDNTTVKVYNPWGFSVVSDTNPTPGHIAPFDSNLTELVGDAKFDFWVGI